MGLFDRRDPKKRSDAFDSPVETIDLNAPPPDPEPPMSEQASSDGASPVDYGIEQAIQLMRTLPHDNVELVVEVVKHTLESTQIQLTRIIDDASQKQEDIQGRIAVLREEIADYEKEIATRRAEIETLDAVYEETSMVKDRLMLAENLGKGGAGAKGSGNHPARGKPGVEYTNRPKRVSEPPPLPGVAKAAEPAAKK